MSITKDTKQSLIQEYKTNAQDTGSPEVQVSILTERIKNMTAHMKQHKKDLHSQRGLIMMVNRRRRLLRYVKNKNEQRYKDLIARLGLRH